MSENLENDVLNAVALSKTIRKSSMSIQEYERIQNELRGKLTYCNGLDGKRREGFKEGIRAAMSILHSHKPTE